MKEPHLRAGPEPTQLEHLSDASILGKLLVLPANVRLDWKGIARYKHSSLFGLIISNEGNKFYDTDTWSSDSPMMTAKGIPVSSQYWSWFNIFGFFLYGCSVYKNKREASGAAQCLQAKPGAYLRVACLKDAPPPEMGFDLTCKY